jgi:hypothetical protein
LLEARDVPSGTGLLLFLLTGPLQQQTQAVSLDATKLLTDVNAEVAAPLLVGPAGSAQSVAPAVNTDLNTLKGDFTRLQGTTRFDQFVFFLAFGANLDQGDLFSVFVFFGALQNAANDVGNLPAAVGALGARPLEFFPALTVNGAQQLFGFPPVALQ